MLTIQKAKAETVNTEPVPVEHSLSNVYIEGPHAVVHVSSSLTGMLELEMYSISEPYMALLVSPCFPPQKANRNVPLAFG